MGKMKSVILQNLLAGPGVKDTSPDSNLWHVRNYEAVADRVFVLFLGFRKGGKKVLRRGNTIIIAVGTGSNAKDIFLSPFKLYKFVKRLKPAMTITYEQVFLWWTLLFVRLLTRTVNIMIPIALPAKIYEITGKSLSGRLPIWFEKIFRRWSFRMVTKVVTTKNLGDYKKWLLNDRIGKKKAVIMNKLPEEAPSINFLSNINRQRAVPSADSPAYNLVTVGRLQKEKLIDHTILAMAELVKKDPRYKLYIIGDGEERQNLEELVKKNMLTQQVEFKGYLNTAQIIEHCKEMHVFLSPYTGGALREAALLNLPIVAYNTDWIKDELKPDIEYAAVEFLNYKQMAGQVNRVITDQAFTGMLVSNMAEKAKILWTLTGLDKEFEVFFSKN